MRTSAAEIHSRLGNSWPAVLAQLGIDEERVLVVLALASDVRGRPGLYAHATLLPAAHPHYTGVVQSLLFDGANSAVLLTEETSRFEFRVALPQTGRFADLKVGERVFFGFDPLRAICFSAANSS